MTQLILLLASAAAAVPAKAPTPTPPAEVLPWPVHLAGDIAWPLAALGIALILWRPLSDLIRSGRITKFSIFNVGIELTPATSAPETPLVNELRDASVAFVGDSSRALMEQVQSDKPAHFAIIDIGEGKEWLTSRLYVAAIMLSRMNGARVFVFVETVGATRRRFIAVASIDQLRWALARAYPWLESAWMRAFAGAYQGLDPKNMMPPNWTIVTSDSGAIEPQKAVEIANAFLGQLRNYVPQPPPAPVKRGSRVSASPPPPLQAPPGWVRFDDGRQERAAWVTYELLASLIPASSFEAWAPVMTDEPRARRIRAALRRSGDFIALLDEDRSFNRLVNRRTLIDEVAAAAGDEPERGEKSEKARASNSAS